MSNYKKTKTHIKTTMLAFLNEQTENHQYHDLFEYYEEQPPELAEITTKYLDELENGNEAEDDGYKIITKFHDAVYKIGYTFDSGLDAQPYGLRPIGVKLNQLKGWEGEEDDEVETN